MAAGHPPRLPAVVYVLPVGGVLTGSSILPLGGVGAGSSTLFVGGVGSGSCVLASR